MKNTQVLSPLPVAKTNKKLRGLSGLAEVMRQAAKAVRDKKFTDTVRFKDEIGITVEKGAAKQEAHIARIKANIDKVIEANRKAHKA